MSDIVTQITAAIPFADATTIVTAAGLALVGLAFLAFVLRVGMNAASGRISDESSDEDEDDD